MTAFVTDDVTREDKILTALLEGRRITVTVLQKRHMDRSETKHFYLDRVEEAYASLRFDAVEEPADMSEVMNRALTHWADNPVTE